MINRIIIVGHISLIIFSWSVGQGTVGQARVKKGTSGCVKNVILSEAKDLKWPKNEILRYTQNDKKREKCFFTQSDVPNLSH